MTRVVVEADGGSRGNPGPAAYGAVLRDAETGAVLAEDAAVVGVATNNVAEYGGLLAGLRLAREHAPGATVEVRMDSKLVVEQMSGRWKVRHPSMKPLVEQARSLAPEGTTYTWVPRGDNVHADRLVNQALDGTYAPATHAPTDDAPETEPGADSAPAQATSPTAARGWGPAGPKPTTLVLLRHGVTPHTAAKRFSGGLASSDPALSDDGREQARLAGEWLAPIAEQVAAVVTSPVRRTRETAEIVAAVLGREGDVVEVEPGLAEMEFGVWDGLTFAEVAERDQAGLDAWLGSLDAAPEGGESFRVVQARVRAGLAAVLERHPGETVLVVSHVTPIKTLVADALGAPLEAVFRMELSPASVTVISYHPGPDGAATHRPSLRLYNALPPSRDTFNPAASRW